MAANEYVQAYADGTSQHDLAFHEARCTECLEIVDNDGHIDFADYEGKTVITGAWCNKHWKQYGEANNAKS